MTNGKKALLILGGVAAVGASSFILTKDDPNSKIGQFYANLFGLDRNVSSGTNTVKETPELTKVDYTVQTSTSNGTSCSGYVAESFPLRKCQKGTKIKNVQTILNTLYTTKIGKQLVVDGYFGPGTETALIKATGKASLTEKEYNSLASDANTKSVPEFDIIKYVSDLF